MPCHRLVYSLFIFIWSPSFLSSLPKLCSQYNLFLFQTFNLWSKLFSSLIFLQSISPVYTWDNWKKPHLCLSPILCSNVEEFCGSAVKKIVLFLLIAQDGIKLYQQKSLQTLNYFFLNTFNNILLTTYLIRKIPYLLYHFEPHVENVLFIFLYTFMSLKIFLLLNVLATSENIFSIFKQVSCLMSFSIFVGFLCISPGQCISFLWCRAQKWTW